jgi:hypothetical protein
MNTFLGIALAVAGTLASFFLGEIFILAIVVALTRALRRRSPDYTPALPRHHYPRY